MSSRSEFAAAMEQAMHAAGEIQKTVAGAVGLMPQSIGRILAGGQHPKKGTGYMITKCLVRRLNDAIAAKSKEIEELRAVGNRLKEAYLDEYERE